MLEPVHLLPRADHLFFVAVVRETDHETAAGLEHSARLTEHIERLGEVVDPSDAGDHVKRAILIRKRGLRVQILHSPISQLVVGIHLYFIHPESRDSAHGGFPARRVVRDPAAADVQHGRASRERQLSLVVVRQPTNKTFLRGAESYCPKMSGFIREAIESLSKRRRGLSPRRKDRAR